MTAIIKKELHTYFHSMIGYIFLGFFVLLTAIFFAFINVLQLMPDYSYVLSGTSIILLILIPILTMRLFAEEARQKTDQLLFTAPLSVNEIVIGKYLAALILYLIGMAITLIFPISISSYGEIPTAKIMGAVLGYVLLGASFISVGLFISVLTDNQIISAVVTCAVLLMLFIMNSIAVALPADRASSIIFVCAVVIGLAFMLYDSTKNHKAGIILAVVGLAAVAVLYFINNIIFDAAMVKVFQWFAVLTHFETFNRGVLNIADIVYFCTFIAAFVYLTANVIEKRRWR